MSAPLFQPCKTYAEIMAFAYIMDFIMSPAHVIILETSAQSRNKRVDISGRTSAT
jgi:hypothetical protein